MRVAIVCPYDLGVPGGVQNQAVGIGEALSRLGHTVMLVAPGEKEVAATELFTVELVGSTIAIPANGSVARVSLSPLAIVWSRRAIAQFEPDIVHIHEPLVPGPALGVLLETSAPVVATFHRSGAGRGYRLLRGFVRHELKHVSEIVAVSNEAKSTLESVVGRALPNVEIISNGVDLEAFHDVEAEPSEQLHLLFVGRHEERKGLGVLLEAMRQVDRSWTLWIVGDGPLTKDLKYRARDIGNIEWLGPLNQEQLRERLVSADLFVAPSISGESFGVVLLEAMAARTAVLASDLPGYRNAGGSRASYVAPDDPTLLAREIRRLMTDETLRSALVVSGAERVQSFGFPAISAHYVTRFERAIAERALDPGLLNKHTRKKLNST